MQEMLLLQFKTATKLSLLNSTYESIIKVEQCKRVLLNSGMVESDIELLMNDSLLELF